jgi:transcription antitermination protein NusB
VRRTDQRRAAIFILYQHDVTGAPLAKLLEQGVALPDDGRSAQTRSALGEAVTGFTRELVEGVESVREELDELIEEQAIGWHVERIAPLERAILRVTLYEIMYRPDVPDEVAIDEAIENAKLYCGAQAPAFVNGILGGVLRKIKRD